MKRKKLRIEERVSEMALEAFRLGEEKGPFLFRETISA
jgi:hypothetical protein